jgi:hypothetical protein
MSPASKKKDKEETYPGAPRPGMIPNQAPEGLAPSISVAPSGEAGAAESAEAGDASAEGAGPSGGA